MFGHLNMNIYQKECL